VTQTAMLDSDLNILGPERSKINGFEHHRLFRRLRHPCLVWHRDSCSETWAGLDGGSSSRPVLLQYAGWLGTGTG